MHKDETKKLLTPEIIAQVAKQYAIESDSVKYVGGFENIIYQGLRNLKPVILRFTHDNHRTAEEILSELHWLEFLKVNNANVCSPYPSEAGNLVETVVIQKTPIHISVFEKAPGKMIDIRKERDNLQLFQAWGRATGKLHRLTRDYNRPPQVIKREDNVDIFDNTLAQYIPDEPELLARIKHILDQVRALPKTDDWYDFIHSDIHMYNFFYDGQELHIFDFDDCCFHQLASDIAIPLYYAIWGNNLETQEQKDEFGKVFSRYFLQGYLEEHPLTKEQLLTIPILLQLRDCELLCVLMAEFDQFMDEKDVALINSFKTRLLENCLIVNVDWDKVYQEVTNKD